MKNILIATILYSYSLGSIIHDRPPYFINDFPIILEIFWTEKENPQYAQIFYKELLAKEYKISTMACNSKGCRAIIPAQSEKSFRYFMKIKLCSGRVIESASIIVYMKNLPYWQKDVETQSGFINLYGTNRNLKGFNSDKVLFYEKSNEVNQQPQRVIKYNKINIENDDKDKQSWWSFWQNDSTEDQQNKSDLEIEENYNNYFQKRKYEEIFTP